MKNIVIAVICVIALFINACSPSHKVSSAEFGKYISGFTSGKIEPDAEIKIELTAEIIDSIPESKRDSTFLKDHISISPHVDGAYYWLNNRTIGFKPAAHFKQGKQYHVEMQLGDFIRTASKFNTFEFNFETGIQKMDVSEIGLKLNNPYISEWQRYEMELISNADADPKKLQQCFNATQGNRNLVITCVQTEPKHYKIIVDSIERKREEGKVALSWNFKKAGIDGNGSKTITIPTLGNFKVLGMDVKDEGDQQVDITFSDAILPNQKLDGLIEIEDAKDIRFKLCAALKVW